MPDSNGDPSRNTSDSLPPQGHALATGTRNDCNGGGGPALATGARDDSNGDDNGGGGPAWRRQAPRQQRKRLVQGEGGRGESNCGGGSSGDGGGDNGDDDNGGGDNDNDGGDDNDDGGDDDHNGGNGGKGGGGCNTATAVGIDRQVKNQLKAAIDTGRGRPRGGGRGHGQRRHGSFL